MSAIRDDWLLRQERGGVAGWMTYRIRFGFSSVVILICGNVLTADFLRFCNHCRRRIPPPQPYNFSTHCDELLLMRADWYDSAQARKGVEEGERYGEEGIDDRENFLTIRAVVAWTVPVRVDFENFGVVGAHVPYERGEIVPGMVTVLCD